MKILHLLDEPWDSGITAYALQIASLQKVHGEEVVFGLRFGKRPEALAREQGLRVERIENFFHLLRLLTSEDWDLINAHSGRPHSWAVLIRSFFLRGRKKGIPIIRTRGDARPLSANMLLRFAYKRTSAVIAASDHIGKQYQEKFSLGEDRLKTIYPSVRVDEKVTPLPAKTVGLLGRLDPVKGHVVFLEAAARIHKSLPDAKFFIAGKEAGLTAKMIEDHANSLGLRDSFVFLGYVPFAEAFMRTCTLGVIPSLGSEEVSRVCLEWMGVGRPVVGTLVGSLPELIEFRETGLVVPPNDSVELAEAILEILKKPEDARRMGENARHVARDRFSEKVQLDKTLQLYRWALRRSINHA
ncbi:MAG: glycosyltransferase family 4 protein [Elusimicrobia bacterium]|nr:glycosyltransferase family 4 protein [Candidatus Obscuribacterium magneticum]